MVNLVPALLGVLFIGLKLTHQIDWSWIWVLAPFWVGAALCLIIFVMMVIFAGGMLGVSALLDRRLSKSRPNALRR